MCACVWCERGIVCTRGVLACHSTCTAVRRQPCGTGSLLSLWGIYGCSCSTVCTTNASIFWGILLALSTLYFETRSYWFDSFDSARMKGQWAARIRQSPPPRCWGRRQLLQTPGFVTRVLGIRSLLFMFAPQFTNWTISQLLIEDFLNTAEFPKQIPVT